MPSASPEPPRMVVRITARSAVAAVAAVVLAVVAQRVFVAAHAPLSWAAAAVVVAVLIDPVVDVLDRRIPRLPAVILALLVTTVAVWGVIYVALDELGTAVDRLGQSARQAATELEVRDDGVGDLATDADAARRVDEFVDALNERVTGGREVIESTAGTAPTYFLGGILVLFLLSYGPRLARAAVEQLPDPAQQARLTATVTAALHRARRAIFFAVGEGLATGLAVAMAARLLGMPVPAALGLAAGVMAVLPHVGLVLGTLPLILLVLALRSDAAALVTAAVVLVAQLADSFWLRRRVAARSVRVGLLVPWVVLLVGYAVYGVGGAAYGLAFAVFGLALVDEIGERRPVGRPAPGSGTGDATGEPAEPGTVDATGGPARGGGTDGGQPRPSTPPGHAGQRGRTP